MIPPHTAKTRKVQASGPIPRRAAPAPPKIMAASADPDIDIRIGMARRDRSPHTRQKARGSFQALDHCSLSCSSTVHDGRRVTVATKVEISTAATTTSRPSHSWPGAVWLKRVRFSEKLSE